MSLKIVKTSEICDKDFGIAESSTLTDPPISTIRTSLEGIVEISGKFPKNFNRKHKSTSNKINSSIFDKTLFKEKLIVFKNLNLKNSEMEWFTGGIGEAIQTAKAARGIFVVVVVNGNLFLSPVTFCFYVKNKFKKESTILKHAIQLC